MTGVWNTTFQNALQSMSRIRFRHQSGPPPCSAPQTSVPALLESWLAGPLTLAEPVAASASAASTTPAKSQSLRRCIYSLRSLWGCTPQSRIRPTPFQGRAAHSVTGRRFPSCGYFDARQGAFVSALWLAGEGVRPADDFEDLLGDFGLPGPVHGQGQVVNQLPGVLRGVPHRRHPGAVLGGGRFQQGAVQLGLYVHREQPLEDLLRLRLEDEVAARGVLLTLRVVRRQEVLRQREELLDRHPLNQRRFERVVDDDDPVDLLVRVELGDPVRDRLRIRVTGLVGEAGELPGELEAPEAQGADSAPPDADPADLLALAPKLPLERESPPQDLRVERPGEAAVTRQGH